VCAVCSLFVLHTLTTDELVASLVAHHSSWPDLIGERSLISLPRIALVEPIPPMSGVELLHAALSSLSSPSSTKAPLAVIVPRSTARPESRLGQRRCFVWRVRERINSHARLGRRQPHLRVRRGRCRGCNGEVCGECGQGYDRRWGMRFRQSRYRLVSSPSQHQMARSRPATKSRNSKNQQVCETSRFRAQVGLVTG
jgi:hypothetical protein